MMPHLLACVSAYDIPALLAHIQSDEDKGQPLRASPLANPQGWSSTSVYTDFSILGGALPPFFFHLGMTNLGGYTLAFHHRPRGIDEEQ